VLEEGSVLATIGADGENIPYGRPYSTCEPRPTAANPEDFDRELDADVAAAGRTISPANEKKCGRRNSEPTDIVGYRCAVIGKYYAVTVD